MALLYDANPLVTDLPSLSILDAVNRIREDGEDRIAGCLENLQTFVDALTQRLGEIPEGRFEDLIVTDADTGAAIAHIGSFPAGDSILSGVATQNLWVGGDVNDPVNTAPLFTDGTTVVVGQNGRIFLRNTRGDDKGFIGVEAEDPDNPLAVVSAANNGAGLIRIQTATHGYESGDTVDADIPGVASGTWPITVIDATHFDLLGSTFTGAYTGGGTVYRYFGGVWSETAAFGNTGFGDALFRVFADSSLRIGSAAGARLEVDNAGNLSITEGTLSLSLNGITTSIDNVASSPFSGGGIAIGLKIQNDSSGRSSVVADGAFAASFDGSVVGAKLYADVGGPSAGGVLHLCDTSGSTTISGIGSTGAISCNSLVVSGTAFSPSNYYTKSEMDGFLSAINTALAGKSNVGHVHGTISIFSTTGTVAHTHTGQVS